MGQDASNLGKLGPSDVAPIFVARTHHAAIALIVTSPKADQITLSNFWKALEGLLPSTPLKESMNHRMSC